MSLYRLSSAAARMHARAVAPPMRRAQSTVTRKDPQVVARSLLDALPGKDAVTKAGAFTALASLGTFLISKEIFVFNGEVWEAMALLGAYYIWYSASKDGAVEWFAEKKSAFRNALQSARNDHAAVVRERIDHLQQMGNVADVTQNLYAMSKEIAQLEAEQYALKQQTAFAAQVKNTLDAWVRQEASVREREQRQLLQTVLDKINARVGDPEFQAQYLNQVLGDVEKVSRKA